MSCCGGRCFANSSVAASNCIAMSGTGAPGNPLVSVPIIAPTVLDPVTGLPIANGISCGPLGLEVQPYGQIGLTGPYSIGVGLVPTIVADTAPGPHTLGMIDWGPPLLANGVNADANRATLFQRIAQPPVVTATLEPGATVVIGHSIDFPTFDIFEWQMTNTGAVIGTWRWWGNQRAGFGGIAPAGVGSPGPVESWQLTIKTTGFTGPSAVSTLFGSGANISYIGYPI